MLRYDQNHGADSAGRLVAKDSAFSPRVGVVWDPTGDQKWSVTASFAKYVAGDLQQHRRLVVGRPAIRRRSSSSTAGRRSTRPDAIDADARRRFAQVFDWYNANGGANLPLAGAPTIPGVTPVNPGLAGLAEQPRIRGRRQPPASATRAAVRADFVYRNFRDFYATVLDTSTGRVQDQLGKPYDLALDSRTRTI